MNEKLEALIESYINGNKGYVAGEIKKLDADEVIELVDLVTELIPNDEAIRFIKFTVAAVV